MRSDNSGIHAWAQAEIVSVDDEPTVSGRNRKFGSQRRIPHTRTHGISSVRGGAGRLVLRAESRCIS